MLYHRRVTRPSIKFAGIHLQLFRKRLSHKSVKARSALPIGIMGRKSGVDCLRFTVFTDKKRAGINTFVCAVSLYVAEPP